MKRYDVSAAVNSEGHGAALFDAVVALADERQAGRVEWCVLNWNQPTIDFYEQRGAKAKDEWTTYRRTRVSSGGFS